ncbi:site-specific integrase [Salibacteraceae bacterium]|nr:site-specific integrase [Salibacteraceae bacterium]
MATKVTLRQKTISKGRKSLYLDYYPPIPHPDTGEPTRRKFLGIYVQEKPKSVLDKQNKKETLITAEQIRAKEENQLNKRDAYSVYELEMAERAEKGKVDFVPFFLEIANTRKNSNHDNWMATYQYLVNFTGGSIKFKDIDEKWCESFKEYLLTTKSRKSSKVKLATNSAVAYFNKFRVALGDAFRDGFLNVDLKGRVKPIKTAETRREFLTLDEVNKLVETPCNNVLLKKAAIFSCLTGLRFSDIQKLTWEEVVFVKGEGYFLKFTQQKTKGVELLPISDQAFQVLGERGQGDQKVIDGLTYSAYHNKHLFQWIGAAGITKNITFHCFRHTYAVLQVNHGTDVYTVSKMMGHRNVKTTQVYAKIVDQSKRDASNRITLNLDRDE